MRYPLDIPSRDFVEDRLFESTALRYVPSQTRVLMSYLPGAIVSQQPEYSALHLDPLFDGTFDQCLPTMQTQVVEVVKWLCSVLGMQAFSVAYFGH